MKLCMKNYENSSIIVKVTSKKSVAPFYVDTVCIYIYIYIYIIKHEHGRHRGTQKP